MAKLQIYKYHNNPDKLLQPNTEYKFGGTFIGKFNGKEIIVSKLIYEKSFKWYNAISYCKSLDIEGYKDWYLPSKDELNFMYENKDKMHEIDEFAGNRYWSSTEKNGSAWLQYFDDGAQVYIDKNYSIYVRAIRSQ